MMSICIFIVRDIEKFVEGWYLRRYSPKTTQEYHPSDWKGSCLDIYKKTLPIKIPKETTAKEIKQIAITLSNLAISLLSCLNRMTSLRIVHKKLAISGYGKSNLRTDVPIPITSIIIAINENVALWGSLPKSQNCLRNKIPQTINNTISNGFIFSFSFL